MLRSKSVVSSRCSSTTRATRSRTWLLLFERRSWLEVESSWRRWRSVATSSDRRKSRSPLENTPHQSRVGSRSASSSNTATPISVSVSIASIDESRHPPATMRECGGWQLSWARSDASSARTDGHRTDAATAKATTACRNVLIDLSFSPPTGPGSSP